MKRKKQSKKNILKSPKKPEQEKEIPKEIGVFNDFLIFDKVDNSKDNNLDIQNKNFDEPSLKEGLIIPTNQNKKKSRFFNLFKEIVEKDKKILLKNKKNEEKNDVLPNKNEININKDEDIKNNNNTSNNNLDKDNNIIFNNYDDNIINNDNNKIINENNKDDNIDDLNIINDNKEERNKIYSYKCINPEDLKVNINDEQEEAKIEIILKNNGNMIWPEDTKLMIDKDSFFSLDEIKLKPQKPGEKEKYNIILKNLGEYPPNKYTLYLWFYANEEQFGEKITLIIEVIRRKIKYKRVGKEKFNKLNEFKKIYGFDDEYIQDIDLLEVLEKYEFNYDKAFENLSSYLQDKYNKNKK